MGPRDDVLLLSLTSDGRLASPHPFEAFRERLGAATDCFVFCHGWLNDQTEARDGALRFFAHLDTALQPLRDRVVPLRLAIHWPSRPFADPAPARLAGQPEAMPAPLGRLGALARRQPGALASVIALLCEAEVALSPEDELELDALVRQIGDAARRGGLSASPLQALSFWLMKRRAGQVGERLGREWLAPALAVLGDRAPRVHLIGHSFGAKLVTSAVLAGVRRQLYLKNFPDAHGIVHGDIRECRQKVPAHDILCAGFPCQPFSKSGNQRGMRDETRGTLFHEILEILKWRRPQYVILENVGNFERHDHGRTWRIVKRSLAALGYHVRGTEHVSSGGPGLVSPHHLGFPHTRERFVVVASLDELPLYPFPRPQRDRVTRLSDIVQAKSELSRVDAEETTLSWQRISCIDHWNKLLGRIPDRVDLPSFPIWGDEIDASYPFETTTPHATPLHKLRKLVSGNGIPSQLKKIDVLNLLPSYARTAERRFPDWKVAFIRQNRTWFSEIQSYVPASWVPTLRQFPPSLRKLEWNCKGEERDLWCHVLQFRPSGLRAKRYSSSPALVAMTTTQIPILGPKRRFLTRVEGLRLQSFSDSHSLPASRASAFSALGNAVHIGVVIAIARRLLANHN
jgi:DNA (cytosine-5)-methyltransferase 1